MCRSCSGGGIGNSGTLTITKSTISGNSIDSNCEAICFSFGGGVFNTGTLMISNSTLTGNRVHTYCQQRCFVSGGGIYGSPTISNSTISENSISGHGGTGGGIIGNATLQNSIVADNFGGNCSGTMTSNGYNLSSDSTCNFNSSGDLNNTDPKLGTLGNYGGPTQTIPLLSGSPAIDAGNPKGCADGNDHLLKTDQRGKPRPDREDKTGCDMGAYERQSD